MMKIILLILGAVVILFIAWLGYSSNNAPPPEKQWDQ